MAGRDAQFRARHVTALNPSTGPSYETPEDHVDSRVINQAGRSDSGSESVRKQQEKERAYTWRDGDRILTVLLQPDLEVTPGGTIGTRADTVVRAARNETQGRTARSEVSSQAIPSDLPVFQSQSGALMTLPGGVLLALDKTWSAEQTDAFFGRNGIKPAQVSELGYIANGFYVETEPGFPSLELANSLAEQRGVRISTPNWQRDLVAE